MTSIGLINPGDSSGKVFEDESGGNYRRFVFQDTKLAGCILLGDTTGAAQLGKIIESGADFSSLTAGQPAAAAITAHLLKR